MSEKTLNNLIATLKTEAIEVAEKEADVIVKAAHEEAQRILSDAQEIQQHTLLAAENDAQVILGKGESALRQAKRDVIVYLQNDLIQLLKSVLERDVKANFTPEILKSAVVKVIENIGGDVELKLSTDLQEGLADYVQQRLQDSDNLVDISVDSNLSKNLGITKKDQGWSYDISPETVTELLGSHLSKKWIKILKKETEK